MTDSTHPANRTGLDLLEKCIFDVLHSVRIHAHRTIESAQVGAILSTMLATSDPVKLFTNKTDTYARFIQLVRYPQGLRAFFLRSSLLRSDLRVLDAGCGTGVVTLALLDAFAQRRLTRGSMHAFDLTPAMLERFQHSLECRSIEGVELRQANVLELESLPDDWTQYDLIVSASMLEYVPCNRFADALSGLRDRLRDGGQLVLFITKRNVLTRLMIGQWWQSNLYSKKELRHAFRRAGFSEASFSAFPLAARYLARGVTSSRRENESA